MYSAMTNTFFECKEVYLGYGEAAAGLGLMTGPIIGGFLYNLFNVKVCYIVLAMIIFLDVIFTMIFLPSNPASS
jgi:MFS family permease